MDNLKEIDNSGEDKSRGIVTIGYGTSQERKLEVEEFVQSKFVDNRLVSVALLEDETYILSVENPQSSGRAERSNIRLGKESFLALIGTAFMYFGCKGQDLGKLLHEVVGEGDLEYTFSDNLKPLDFSKKNEE